MKILVVDDEDLARQRLVRLLARVRPEAVVLEAGDGQEALALVAREQADLEAALQAAVRVNRAQLGALGVAAGARETIASSGHRGVEALPVAEVRCFLAEDKYVRACAPQGELLLSDSLRELEEECAGRFLRVHRNALVARAHVVRLQRAGDGWSVELDACRERPRVSRRHLAAVKAAVAGAPPGE